MKKCNLLKVMALSTVCLVSSSFLNAQQLNPAIYGPQVNTIPSNVPKYVPNEVIVKFKDTSGVRVQLGKSHTIRTTSVKSVDNKLASMGISVAEPLMPLTGAKKLHKGNQVLKSLSGREVVEPDMSRLYLMKVDSTKNMSVLEVIKQLKTVAEVEYAEPNYYVYSMATESSATYTGEPLYSEQWGLGAINMPALWDVEKITDERPVIAIIDTGVDTTHPGLADNLWTNTAEADGEDYADDDGNGFYDDVHGWDFVNKTPNVKDFNGHGTHCAGIAAAVGNNGIGITGANPDALIMPVAVMQSNGTGDVGTIIKGIDCATANGADVISMSIGTYSTSMAFEQSLAKAYQKAVLVAAAGNDGMCIYPHKCDINNKKAEDNGPMFPAAYTFVLGVQALGDNGELARFSNFDCDGAFFSNSDYFGKEQLYNYELMAPGVNIMSTYPGGQYKSFNGTSMACPLVAGAISRLLQCKEYLSKEILFGDLINTSPDIYSAYLINDDDRKPKLTVVSNGMDDTETGDGDYRADAGELINFYPTIKNFTGEAKNIVVSIEMGELEDSTLVEFITNNISLGSNLSSYATGVSATPLQIKINSDCVDGRIIKLRMRATCDNIEEDCVQDFEIKVENGVELTRIINEDMTLYPNVHYIVTHGCLIAEGAKLTIMPGTVIKIKDGAILELLGTVKCAGIPEEPIVFTKADLDQGTGTIEGGGIFKYTIIENLQLTESFAGSCTNCIIRDNDLSNIFATCYKTNIIYNKSSIGQIWSPAGNLCNVIENENDCNFFLGNSNTFSLYTTSGDTYYSVLYIGDYSVIKPENPSYLGTSSEDVVKNYIIDMYHPTSDAHNFMIFDYSNMLKAPVAEAHGIVWKVVVNGYDAQDEYDLLPPLGVGKHKFEVYFNRPMNKAVEPMVAMGVRPPYTQIAIAEDGSWNEEGTIYTVYLTITGKSAFDGVNRIYVSGAEDDEYFEIPIEQRRFNVNVQVAGAMSTGFMAGSGLGRVYLTWEKPDVDIDDMLGYNMYRYTMLDGEQPSDTICVSESMIDIDDTKFVDKNVVAGETYYYYYTVLSTGLTESIPSRVVSATPLTVTLGDADGSTKVDYEYIVAEVEYITNQNPQPFVFEAADVNMDDVVNILDVISTANIANNITITTPDNNSVKYTIENGVLYVNTPVSLGGIQLLLNSVDVSNVKKHENLSGFELVVDNTDNGCLVLIYSMTDKTIPTGKQAILNIGSADITEVVLCDATGKSIIGINGDTSGVGAIETMQMELPYPNPFSDVLTVPYKVGKDGVHDVKIAVTSVTGATVAVHSGKAEYGCYTWTWNAGESVSAGVYFISLYVDGRLMQTEKAVKR